MAAIDELPWREDDDPTTATLWEMTGVTGHKDVRGRCPQPRGTSRRSDRAARSTMTVPPPLAGRIRRWSRTDRRRDLQATPTLTARASILVFLLFSYLTAPPDVDGRAEPRGRDLPPVVLRWVRPWGGGRRVCHGASSHGRAGSPRRTGPARGAILEERGCQGRVREWRIVDFCQQMRGFSSGHRSVVDRFVVVVAVHLDAVPSVEHHRGCRLQRSTA